MSWHFLQGQAEGSWEGDSSGGQLSALSSLMPSAALCFSHGSGTVPSTGSPSGMTYGPSTGSPGEGTSTSSPEASPARTSVPQAPAPALREPVAASGESSPASSKRSNRRTSSSKTPRTYVLADLLPSSKTLPAWGSMRDGVCSEPKPSVRRIGVSACGLLPTPTGAGNEGSPSVQKWAAHRRLMALLQGRQIPTLRANKWGNEDSHGNTEAWDAVERVLIPTPLASDRMGNNPRGAGSRAAGGGQRLLLADMQALLPTPTATLYSYNQGGSAGRVGPKRYSLEKYTGGPWISFREWMMGWPIGWSALEPLATARFQEWLLWHGRR